MYEPVHKRAPWLARWVRRQCCPRAFRFGCVCALYTGLVFEIHSSVRRTIVDTHYGEAERRRARGGARESRTRVRLMINFQQRTIQTAPHSSRYRPGTREIDSNSLNMDTRTHSHLHGQRWSRKGSERKSGVPQGPNGSKSEAQRGTEPLLASPCQRPLDMLMLRTQIAAEAFLATAMNMQRA